MKNKKAFYLTDILIGISIFLLVTNIGFICIRKIKEEREINTAKILIYETFSTYATKAFYNKEHYYIRLDYTTKKLYVLKFMHVPLEIIQLPEKLNYVTIFDKTVQKEHLAKITRYGNITPSFSIYIFGYNNIARYRISFYGFDIIKYMKINIYKNKNDKNATYVNIHNFHKKWDGNSLSWVEE